MRNPTVTIRRFFEAYAKRMNDALAGKPKIDVIGVVSSFADYFVEASPAGVVGAKNGFKFRLAVPRGIAFYRKIGTVKMLISSLRVTRLDDLHFVARVGWDSRYLDKKGKRVRIRFANIYMLQMQKGKPRVFAYVTGDEHKLLEQHGLV